MATQPIDQSELNVYVDDSRYERIGGRLLERPLPGLEHAELQKRIVELLSPFAEASGCKVHSEWSISDAAGNWITPDVTLSNPDWKITRRGHLIIPAHLVVEIRSVDQPLKDLFDKREYYRKWQIPFYWIVDPIERACYETEPFLSGAAIFLSCRESLHAGNIEVAVGDVFVS